MPIRDLARLAGLLLLLAAAPARAQDAVGQIAATQGAVGHRPAGQADWLEARPGAPLRPGDALATQAQSVAQLGLGDAAATLAGGGSLAVGARVAAGGVLALSGGQLALGSGPGPGWQIDTPRGAVRLDAPARILVEAGDDAAPTRISVLDGAVRLLPAGLVLAAGQTARLDGDPASPRLAVEPTPPLDAAARALADSVLAPAPPPVPPSSAVPPPPGPPVEAPVGIVAPPEAAPLTQYGSWTSEPGWGAVWYPAGLPAGWSPYATGGSAWIAAWGPVPWREGRWVRLRGRWGWCPGPPERRPAALPPPRAMLPPARVAPAPSHWHAPAAPASRPPAAAMRPAPHLVSPAARPSAAPAARPFVAPSARASVAPVARPPVAPAARAVPPPVPHRGPPPAATAQPRGAPVPHERERRRSRP